MSPEQLFFVGFFPKKLCRDTRFLNVPQVKQICSVSDCISESPKEWVTKWLHNDMSFFDTEALALKVIPEGQESEFELFAYELFPLCFDENGMHDFVSEVQLNRPDLSTYEMIGYDLVSKQPNRLYQNPPEIHAFECSPLSCNNRAVDYPVNEHCLLDDYNVAIKAGLDFASGGGEPGPYHLIKVLKKKAF